MENKTNIIETRSIGFGSSDSKMIVSVGRNGKLNKSAKDRIAILLGQKEKQQFSTISTKYGDFIEEKIFDYLKNNPSFKEYSFTSNPYYEVPDLKYRFKCFNHIDIEAKLDNTVIWFEIKAVNDSAIKTLNKYKEQLEWHYWVLKTTYPDKNIKLYLVHYHTKDKVSDFDPLNISLLEYIENIKLKNLIISGLNFIDHNIDSFKYQEQNRLSVTKLPAVLEVQLNEIYLFKKQESVMKIRIKDFADKMNTLMKERGIDSIRTETILINRVDDSETKSIDIEYLEKKHPKIYKKCLISKIRKGYVSLKTI